MRMRKASCRECSISKRKAMHTHIFTHDSHTHIIDCAHRPLLSDLSRRRQIVNLERHDLLPNRLEAQTPRRSNTPS